MSPRTFTLRHLFIGLKYALQYLCIHHPQGTRILIWFKCIWLSFLMCPFTVSWQKLQHIKNGIYNILVFYRQICVNQISLSITWPVRSLLRCLPILQTCCGVFWAMLTESLVSLAYHYAVILLYLSSWTLWSSIIKICSFQFQGCLQHHQSCKIWGSLSGVAEDWSLSGCDDAPVGE